MVRGEATRNRQSGTRLRLVLYCRFQHFFHAGGRLKGSAFVPSASKVPASSRSRRPPVCVRRVTRAIVTTQEFATSNGFHSSTTFCVPSCELTNSIVNSVNFSDHNALINGTPHPLSWGWVGGSGGLQGRRSRGVHGRPTFESFF